MTIAPGTRLGPYEIVAPIGAGGMGEVWKARDTRLDRNVAIKILPAALAQDPQFRMRFEREAKTISQLNHPHICTLHDVGRENGLDYLVMELLDGELLADRLTRGALPLSDVLKYGAQIAEALHKAHQNGVVHRDLKPGNVMITKSGAKLLDFGLAKASVSGVLSPATAESATQHKPLTQEGTILGTFQYMAPEQLEGLEADARTDIFALGALLYEMVTGTRAFEGGTKTSLIAAIVSKDPKPISQVQPLAPPALEHLVAKCLSKDADDRWQSAHDIAEELRWLGEAGSQAGVAAPLAARKRFRLRLAWSVAAVLAVALVVFGWLYVRLVRQASRPFVSDLTAPAGMRFNAIGDESGALVISPDGMLAVCSVTTGQMPQLWLRSFVTGEAKAITGTNGATFPFWSPDSKKIGFFTTGQLKTVDVTGGAPVTICGVSASRGGAWGADGWIVFTSSTQSPIYRVRESGGGAPVEITKIEQGQHTSHRWPSFLPDGKHFLYLAANHQNPTGGENGIYLSSIEGGPPRRVVQATSNGEYADGYLLYVREQTLVAQRMAPSGSLEGEPVAIAENVLNDSGIWRGAFSVSRSGLLSYHSGRATLLSNLSWLDRAGKEVGRVGDTAAYWDPQLSANGQKLAIPIGDPLREMWIADLQRNTRTRLPLEKAWAYTGVFSPDGSMLYFTILRNGRGELVARRTTGGAETRLLQLDGQVALASISPDGKTLLGDSGQGLLRISLGPPVAATKITHDKTPEYAPEFSADGKWITYASDLNGRVEIFVMSAAESTLKWQVSNSGGFFPRWRRDGKEIFYIDLTNRMNAVSIEPLGEDLSIGTPHPLFSFNPRPQCRPYDVSADGQRFLVNTTAEQESPTVVVVSNWKARLSR